MSAVSLHKLIKDYGGVRAVDDVSLEIAAGEFVVLVGPSGCGKTTLLRMIAGLESPSAGGIRIGDRAVNEVPPRDRDVAMVFQNYALYPHMSVRQNLGFRLKLRKTPKPEIASRIDAAAQLLGIGELLDRKPKQLSGGQRQRVALGRAIVRQPRVFLFDEPLSNLDAKLRGDMRRELANLHRQLAATMVYVTHDQVEAMTLGDRIVLMRDGRVQQTGPPMELYDEPVNQFVAGFLGSPPMNFLSGRTATGGDTSHFHIGSQQVLVPSIAASAATLGLRPERLSINTADAEISLNARVDEVQPLGGETLLHVDVEGQAVTVKMGSLPQVSRGDAVQVSARIDDCLWFDADGKTVAPKKPGF